MITGGTITAGDTTITERLSMAVVQLAAWLVQSRMYEGDRAEHGEQEQQERTSCEGRQTPTPA